MLIDHIFSWLGASLSYCFTVWVDFYTSLGAVGYFFTFFTIASVCSFLIMPLIARGLSSGSSDKINKKKDKEGA